MTDLYQELFDRHPSVTIVVDPETSRIVDASRAACDFYGYTRDELLALRVSDLNTLSPEEIRSRMAEARVGKRDPFYFQHRRKNGEVRDVEVYSGPFEAGGRALLCSIVHDVTARRRAEDRLREQEELYRFVTENGNDMIARHDVTGRMTFVSDGSRRLVGYEPSELVGHTPMRIIHPDDRAEVYEQRKRAFEQAEAAMFVYRAVRKDGEVVWFETSSRIVRDPDTGTSRGSVSVTRDVTERVATQRALEESARQLERMQRVESLSLLAGGVAHDFNNLLSIVMAGLDLLETGLTEGAPGRAHLEHARTAARRGAELCRQMLTYAGRSTHASEAVDLGRLVREDADLLRLSIEDRVPLDLEGCNASVVVAADATSLRQVLMNLVRNAAEAVGDGPGGVRVRIGEQDVEPPGLTLVGGHVAPGRWAYLEVEDDGAGMPPEVARRVFEPFFTTKFTGRGLGMPVVLGIARSLGGSVDVDSEPGRGTRIRLLLRIDAGPATPVQPRTRQPSQRIGRGRVFVVDDESALRAMLRSALEQLGFVVDDAPNGRVALERIAAGPEPDLVIVDLTMPVMRGDELLRALWERVPTLRAVLISGHGDDEVKRRLGELAGRVQVLPKPFGLDELEAAVLRAME